jgi:hypothetical protein
LFLLHQSAVEEGRLRLRPSRRVWILCTKVRASGSFSDFCKVWQLTLPVISGSSSGQRQATPSWDQRSQQLQQTEASVGGQYPDPAQLSFTFPAHSHSHDVDPQRLSNTNAQVHGNSNGNFLYPIPPRSRSKSDTDLRPPQWATMTQDQLQPNGDGSTFDDDNSATVNLSDILPSQQHPNAHHQSFGMDSVQASQMYPFGSSGGPTNYLSPDMGAQLRRSKSDGQRAGHQRQSRSEDMRHSNAMLYPDTSHQEFMNRQFLHPQESLPVRGHHRRASSGSRGDGSWSNASSTRPSPYPSPSASPRYNQDELPNVGLPGRQPPLLQHEIHDLGNSLSRGMESATMVSKPNVTTGRTANASRIRRKQEANFMCPVPGCGSTFTRSFNLKGNVLRSIDVSLVAYWRLRSLRSYAISQ